MKKTIAVILAAVVLAGCAQVPQNVKDKYGSSSAQDTQSSTSSAQDSSDDKVDISQLDEYSAKLKDYVKQKGYDTNFFLPDNLKINSVSELYNFKMKQASGAYEKFPQVYSYCFGSDFEKDSGVSGTDKLPLSDGERELAGFHRVRSLLLNDVRYVGSKGFDENTNYYITGLNVGNTGFIYYLNDYDPYTYSDYEECKDVYYSKGESDSEQLLMSDGSRCSCDEAKEYAEKFANGLLGIYTSDFEYRVKLVRVSKNDEGNHLFYIIFQKYYKGTPISDLLTYEYHEPIHTKWLHCTCFMGGRERLLDFDAPYGFETLESSERVTDKLIPVTKAVDIMHEKLAEHIKLNIFDVKLMYFNEYDGSRYEKAVEKWENSGHQPLPEDVQKDMYQPEMNENNEYSCYPAWVFYIPMQDQAPSKYGVSEIERHCNYIVINARTGEMKSYIDPASVN